jgi:hypothetical protein
LGTAPPARCSSDKAWTRRRCWKFTHLIDLDLDGIITSNDAAIFNTNYSDNMPAHRSIGDLNYDGVFTPNDAFLFSTLYDESLSGLPEPGSLGLLSLAGLGLVRRRTRHLHSRAARAREQAKVSTSLATGIKSFTAAAVGVGCLAATSAKAAPFLTVDLLGRVQGSGNAFSSTVFVSSGQLVDYNVQVRLGVEGATNASAGASLTQTITNWVPSNGSTSPTGGLQSLLFSLQQSPTPGTIQCNFSSTANGTTTGGSAWGGVSFGSSPGTLTLRGNGDYDLLKVKLFRNSGDFDGIANDESRETLVIADGSFAVASNGSASLLNIDLTGFGPGSIIAGYRWKDSAGINALDVNYVQTVIHQNNSVTANDPIIVFNPLTLSSSNVPGPWLGGTGNWSNSVKWGAGTIPNASSMHVKIDNGNVTASAVTLDQNATIGDLTLDAADSLTINAGRTLTLAGPGPSVLRGALNVANTGRVNVSASGGDSGVIYLNSLNLNTTGTLDLNDNDLVVNNGVFSDVQALVFAGYGTTPNTSLTGIISTVGQNTGGVAILALFNNALFSVTDYPFGSGQTISANAIVGKYTHIGDTDWDGQVTPQDYTAIDANLGATGLDLGLAWFSGDTNFDGNIDPSDYTGIDAALGLGVGNPLAIHAMGAAAVPEPASVGLCVAALAMYEVRRRRSPQ